MLFICYNLVTFIKICAIDINIGVIARKSMLLCETESNGREIYHDQDRQYLQLKYKELNMCKLYYLNSLFIIRDR